MILKNSRLTRIWAVSPTPSWSLCSPKYISSMSKDYSAEITAVLQSPEFQKLKEIGGHKVYHLEGSAYEHTMMVADYSAHLFGVNSFMHLVALLHDIGKIYSSVCHGPDDWSYPNHAKAGAENLAKFIPQSHPDFSKIRWYIANHIKPLFWRGKDLHTAIETLNVPDGCSVIDLAQLAICDIEGSYSIEPQTELLEFLQDFVSSRMIAVYEASKYGLEQEVMSSINQGASPAEALREWDV